jgi:hypothetical protein
MCDRPPPRKAPCRAGRARTRTTSPETLGSAFSECAFHSNQAASSAFVSDLKNVDGSHLVSLGSVFAEV